MLPPVTVRVGTVAGTPEPGEPVPVSFGGEAPIGCIPVGGIPGFGSTVLVLSTYDSAFIVGPVYPNVDTVPVLPPISDAGDNALTLTADGALKVPGWARWGSTVVTLDDARRARITHDLMPPEFAPVNGTYLTQLGDRHVLENPAVLPVAAERGADWFTVEVPGGGAGNRLRINWLVLAERSEYAGDR